jgi:hypothetical protein
MTTGEGICPVSPVQARSPVGVVESEVGPTIRWEVLDHVATLHFLGEPFGVTTPYMLVQKVIASFAWPFNRIQILMSRPFVHKIIIAGCRCLADSLGSALT